MYGSGLVGGVSYSHFPTTHSLLCAVRPGLLAPFCITHTASHAWPSPPLALQRSFIASCEGFIEVRNRHCEKEQAVKGQARLPALWLNIDNNTSRQGPGEGASRSSLPCWNPDPGSSQTHSPVLARGSGCFLFIWGQRVRKKALGSWFFQVTKLRWSLFAI